MSTQSPAEQPCNGKCLHTSTRRCPECLEKYKKEEAQEIQKKRAAQQQKAGMLA